VNNFLPVPAFTWTDISFDWQDIDLPVTWQQQEIDELLEQMQDAIDGISCPWLEFSPDPWNSTSQDTSGLTNWTEHG